MAEIPRDELALESLGESGGDDVCWAHLLCEECGMILNERDEHRTGCTLAPGARD